MIGAPILPAACPNCGHILSGAMSISDRAAKPKPGDFTFCANCFELAVFDADLQLRKLTGEEAIALCKQLWLERVREMRASGAFSDNVAPVLSILATRDGEQRGFLLKAEGEVAVGISTVLLCGAIEKMKGFPAAVPDAARALRLAMMGGREDMPPVEVYTGERGFG